MPPDDQSPDDRWTKVVYELDNLPSGSQGGEREAELLDELARRLGVDRNGSLS